MMQSQDRKTILKIKIAYDKFRRKLDVLRNRERSFIKEYKESDRQAKILDIKKQLEK